jgi:hypothetical protein
MINIHSTLRTNADLLCKNVSLAALYCKNGNSNTLSMRSNMWTYTYSSQYIDAGRAKEIKKIFGQQ